MRSRTGARGESADAEHDVPGEGWTNARRLHDPGAARRRRQVGARAGGAESLLDKARGAFELGDYRWVAEVVNHAVFADPGNQAAKELQAAALEQPGYQSESGPWRNFYLTAAKELRGAR